MKKSNPMMPIKPYDALHLIIYMGKIIILQEMTKYKY